MPASLAFATLSLNPLLTANLARLDYVRMTPIQALALPPILDGRDVLARAKTGSGKTAAFGLGVLNQLDPAAYRTQALVLCPTRELAEQVAGEIRRLARAMPNVKIQSVCGGAPFALQVASLKHPPHVLVATPGRLLKHLDKKTIGLDAVTKVVLDEADRMLDMGFADELDAILDYLPADRQTLLFSATYPESIAAVSSRVQSNPELVDALSSEAPANIAATWCRVTRENRSFALALALSEWGGGLNLVFCNTKKDCAELAKFLRGRGLSAVALHGDLDQAERTEMLVRFSNRSASVLVATDVAARGLDVDDIEAVFNVELPKQAEVYIHRIGRTARAGKEGRAISLVEQREMHRMRLVEDAMPDGHWSEQSLPSVPGDNQRLVPAVGCIEIRGGRRDRLRPGDLLGALTAEGGVAGSAVGSIDLFQSRSYVAIEKSQLSRALKQLSGRPIKGRRFRARICR